MSGVLGIDPGKHFTAWAHKSGPGTPLEFGYTESLGLPVDLCTGDVIVFEVPRYRPRDPRCNTNDLIDVALYGGMAVGSVWCPGVRVVRVSPIEWKGTVPKHIHNKRVLDRMTKEDVTNFGELNVPEHLKHNVLDAIGLVQYWERLENNGK